MVLYQEGLELVRLRPPFLKKKKAPNRKTGILIVLGSKRVMNIPIPDTSIVFFFCTTQTFLSICVFTFYG